MVEYRWRNLLIIGGLILLACGILTVPVHIPLAEGFRTPATSTVPSTPLIQGVNIQQQFSTTGAPIESIAIQLATYKRVNTGTVRLTIQALRGGQWQTLATKTAAKESLQDNAFHSFVFDAPITSTVGEHLAITAVADGDTSQAISWWIDPNLRQPDFQLLVNGTPQPGMAVFSIAYAQESGPLVLLLPDLWMRLTIFLDPLWQAFLLLGLAIVVLTPLLLIGGYLQRGDGA